VREALELINTAQQAATTESREGAKKLAFQQQVTIIPLFFINYLLALKGGPTRDFFIHTQTAAAMFC
jgi:hypothetical protein